MRSDVGGRASRRRRTSTALVDEALASVARLLRRVLDAVRSSDPSGHRCRRPRAPTAGRREGTAVEAVVRPGDRP